MRVGFAGVAFAMLALTPGLGHAQVGHGDRALPQVFRVGVPIAGVQELGIAGTGGYGWTEPVRDGDGDHHRLEGSLAAAVRAFEWGTFWLRAEGRYDVHQDDGMGADTGLTGVPSLGFRLGGNVAPWFAFGGEAEVSLFGGDAPSIVAEATTLEARLLGAFTFPEDGLNVSLMLGFRLDNSGAAVPRPVLLRQGDRVALGASDFHQLVYGVGLSYRIDLVELLAEVSGNALLGDGAPAFPVSPLRGELGARIHVIDELAIELSANVAFSDRPDVASDMGPLVPMEPRVGARVGLRFRLPFASTPDPIEEGEGVVTADPEPGPEEPQGNARVHGVVSDEAGAPIAGASVTLTPEGQEPLAATSDEAGAYAFEAVPIGPATLHIAAEGYDPVELPLSVGPDSSEPVTSPLMASHPNGQLRGMIRSYDARALRARVRVDELDVETTTDAEGFFEIDVPPGTHTVVIEAPGHRTQRREVEVPENGVVVLNADLRRGSRR